MISVIVCTYNRSDLLRTVLESMRTMDIPPGLVWELIVVDNNSSDGTAAVVREFQTTARFEIRYVFESRQGQSHARNRGIVESRGDVLAFTDDDVILHSQWLAELQKSYNWSECMGVGGRIVPLWPCAKPEWLREEGPYALMRAIVSFDQGDEACRLTTPPFGANMSFKKAAFERHGLFRTDLGRVGAGLMGSEDTEFGRRLLRSDEPLLYNPRMIVYHPVEMERASEQYFRRWYFNYGRASIRQGGVTASSRFRARTAALRRLLAYGLKWAVATHRERRLYYKLATWQALGQIREVFGSATSCNDSGIPKLSR